MNTIYISVDKDHPEDDILDLVEALRKMFGKDHIVVQDTLAITSDLPQVMALIRSIPTNGKVASDEKVSGGKYQCIECGAPCGKKGGRCRTHAQLLAAAQRRMKNALAAIVDDLNQPDETEPNDEGVSDEH
jgi:hypothetical protein